MFLIVMNWIKPEIQDQEIIQLKTIQILEMEIIREIIQS